jgi:hypothetical protein
MVLEIFMIDISKAQLEANLIATMQMREAAEWAFHRVKKVLVDLALQFLAIEIDQVKVQDADDPTEWPDERAAPGQVQLSGVHGTDEFAGGVTGNPARN